MKKPKRKSRPRREMNVLDYIRGLKEAAKRIQREEQLLLNFDPRGKLVN